jgi:hypothetical protein
VSPRFVAVLLPLSPRNNAEEQRCRGFLVLLPRTFYCRTDSCGSGSLIAARSGSYHQAAAARVLRAGTAAWSDAVDTLMQACGRQGRSSLSCGGPARPCVAQPPVFHFGPAISPGWRGYGLPLHCWVRIHVVTLPCVDLTQADLSVTSLYALCRAAADVCSWAVLQPFLSASQPPAYERPVLNTWRSCGSHAPFREGTFLPAFVCVAFNKRPSATPN